MKFNVMTKWLGPNIIIEINRPLNIIKINSNVNRII